MFASLLITPLLLPVLAHYHLPRIPVCPHSLPQAWFEEFLLAYHPSLTSHIYFYIYIYIFPYLLSTQAWFEEFLLEYQFEVKRYVVEDRFTAIRLAIGTAVDKDVVVIAGKGHGDYIEYGDGKGGVVRGWFDDAVEASLLGGGWDAMGVVFGELGEWDAIGVGGWLMGVRLWVVDRM